MASIFSAMKNRLVRRRSLGVGESQMQGYEKEKEQEK